MRGSPVLSSLPQSVSPPPLLPPPLHLLPPSYHPARRHRGLSLSAHLLPLHHPDCLVPATAVAAPQSLVDIPIACSCYYAVPTSEKTLPAQGLPVHPTPHRTTLPSPRALPPSLLLLAPFVEKTSSQRLEDSSSSSSSSSTAKPRDLQFQAPRDFYCFFGCPELTLPLCSTNCECPYMVCYFSVS